MCYSSSASNLPDLHRRDTSDEVRFSRDIRPILNQNCMPCHGGVRQKNGVSFLFREEALGRGKSGKRTIVQGKPDESELIARVTSRDPETRMPYHSSPLSPQQIDLLFVGIRGRIRQKSCLLLRSRWKTDEIERNPAKERRLVRLRAWRQPLVFEACENESVERLTRPLLLAHRGQRLRFGSYERPMVFPLRAA